MDNTDHMAVILLQFPAFLIEEKVNNPLIWEETPVHLMFLVSQLICEHKDFCTTYNKPLSETGSFSKR